MEGPVPRSDPMLLGPDLLGALMVVALTVGAWRLGILDARGSVLAGVFGAVITLATDVGWLVLLVVFTGGSFLATRVGYEKKRRFHAHEPHGGRRGWKNVVANGVTATLVAAAGFWVAPERLALPFATAVAVAAADTLASELGGLADDVRLVTEPSRRVPPGTNGGVSLPGFGASLLGAGLVALLAHLIIPLDWQHVRLVTALGFAGSLLDSFLGATLETGRQGDPGLLTKNDVNFVSISVPTLGVLFLSLMGFL